MPDTWNHTPLTDLQFIAGELRATAQILEDACKSLADNGLDRAWTYWTDQIPRKTAALKTFAERARDEVNDQVVSKRFGLQCAAELKKDRSSGELARRNEALAKALTSATPANNAATGKKPAKKKKAT